MRLAFVGRRRLSGCLAVLPINSSRYLPAAHRQFDNQTTTTTSPPFFSSIIAHQLGDGDDDHGERPRKNAKDPYRPT